MDLLADRLAQVVRLGRREARDLLRDLEVLLLVDADPVRDPGDRLEPRVDERDRLLPVLALRVGRDVAHRARPVQRDEGDQVLELRRPHRAQRLAHARRLELEDADRVAAREHLVRLAVVERDLRDFEPASDQAEGLVDHVEVAQPEEVHLQQAELLDVPHPELRDRLLALALPLQGHDVGQRPVRDDDARGVDRVLPHEPLERLREVDDLAHERIPVVRRFQLGARLQAVVEVDLHALGDELRDLVDGAVWNLEHTPRVAHGGARHHRPERDDLRDAVAPVLVGDVVDHPVAAG